MLLLTAVFFITGSSAALMNGRGDIDISVIGHDARLDSITVPQFSSPSEPAILAKLNLKYMSHLKMLSYGGYDQVTKDVRKTTEIIALDDQKKKVLLEMLLNANMTHPFLPPSSELTKGKAGQRTEMAVVMQNLRNAYISEINALADLEDRENLPRSLLNLTKEEGGRKLLWSAIFNHDVKDKDLGVIKDEPEFSDELDPSVYDDHTEHSETKDDYHYDDEDYDYYRDGNYVEEDYKDGDHVDFMKKSEENRAEDREEATIEIGDGDLIVTANAKFWGRSCSNDTACTDTIAFCDTEVGECRPVWWFWLLLAIVFVLLVTACVCCIIHGICNAICCFSPCCK